MTSTVESPLSPASAQFWAAREHRRHAWSDDTGAFSRTPVHDFASHGSDAFSYGAQVLEALAAPEDTAEADRQKPPEIITMGAPPEGYRLPTIDELWAEHERRERNRGLGWV